MLFDKSFDMRVKLLQHCLAPARLTADRFSASCTGLIGSRPGSSQGIPVPLTPASR